MDVAPTFPAWVLHLQRALEIIVLAGAAIMAIAFGFRRVYRTARNIEMLVAHATEQKEFERLSTADRAKLAKDLRDHITEEFDRDAEQHARTVKLVANVEEILREIRPNGGSSIKDVVNQIRTEVAVLNQWKADQPHQ